MKKIVSLLLLIIMALCACSCIYMDFEESSSVENASSNSSNSSTDPILGNCIVDIESFRLEEDRGDTIVIVKYKYTNLDDEPESFSYSVSDYVFQAGIALEERIFVSSSIDYLDNRYTEIKPGVSIYVEVAYELNDTTTDIEVEVYRWLSSSGKKIQKTFSIK